MSNACVECTFEKYVLRKVCVKVCVEVAVGVKQTLDQADL